MRKSRRRCVLCVKGAERGECAVGRRAGTTEGEGGGGVDYNAASGIRCLPTNYLSTKILCHAAQTNQEHWGGRTGTEGEEEGEEDAPVPLAEDRSTKRLLSSLSCHSKGCEDIPPLEAAFTGSTKLVSSCSL